MITFSPVPSELLVKPFDPRPIKCVFHDVDGTHSLIRNWPPVMSIVLHYASIYGLPEGYDSPENVAKLAALADKQPLPETDLFCIESAGLSALTQMEWALRRAVDAGIEQVSCDKAVNQEKIRRIFGGEELFPDLPDTPEMEAFLTLHAPRLFKFYEQVLNAFCRDGNLVAARSDPEKYRVPGSLDFIRFLHDHGVKNYFVTGGVVEKGKGMYEELMVLGYDIGEGCLVDDIVGSTWEDKIPKDVLMQRLADQLGVKGEEILIVGDGRSEVTAGDEMGAAIISRLPEDATYQRELHKKLGTHVIVPDYLDPQLYAMFQ